MEVATVPMMLLERQGRVREVPSAVIGFVEPEVFSGEELRDDSCIGST